MYRKQQYVQGPGPSAASGVHPFGRRRLLCFYHRFYYIIIIIIITDKWTCSSEKVSKAPKVTQL